MVYVIGSLCNIRYFRWRLEQTATTGRAPSENLMGKATPLVAFCTRSNFFYHFVIIILGTQTLGDMIEKMIGKRPNIFFLICWKYISPLATLVRYS